ncbi:ArsR/SmtB family transcription factor [Halobacteriales archaeon Cl-PHB]
MNSAAGQTVERSPAEGFAALGDETRLAILEALGETPTEAVPFSELLARVGVEDSGRFNYHLGKLRDHYVERTDDGYTLRYAGMRVVGAILEGTYGASDPIEPIDLDAPCVDCGGTVQATYRNERAGVRCIDCGNDLAEFGVPPGVVADRDRAALPTVLDEFVRAMVDRAVRGSCPNCSGQVTVTVDDRAGVSEVSGPIVRFDCRRCHEQIRTSPAEALLSHPAIVAFHHDHDVDVREAQSWELDWCRAGTVERVVEDPAQFAVRGVLDDERLTLVVDASLGVVESRREQVS